MDLCFDFKSSSIKSSSPFAVHDFSNSLLEHLTTNFSHKYKELIILCIGTDRSTGDSLGPLVGYKLKPSLSRYENVLVLGTLDEPVHAKNLEQKIKFIESNFTNPYIIAIDACLGRYDRVGCINIKKGPLKPGLGVNKKLPVVGDLSITGVVNISGIMEYMVLQNTRLNLVMNMADIISKGLNITLWQYFKEIKEEKSKS